jgi:hypothetical protein
MAVSLSLERYRELVGSRSFIRHMGRVTKVVGLTIETEGPQTHIGELCRIHGGRIGKDMLAEVVGFRDAHVLMMPIGDMTGISPGNPVTATGHQLEIAVGPELLGRVLDGMGRPLDGKGPVAVSRWVPVQNMPPNPMTRPRIQQILPLGVKCLAGLMTVGKGQRMGIFAGSGVGKSTLMGMIARNTKADINVIALIGERGREVRDFLERDLQAEGLARSVVVIATSDQPALVRLKGALTATAIAEYFRDEGKDVLLLMDSLPAFPWPSVKSAWPSGSRRFRAGIRRRCFPCCPSCSNGGHLGAGLHHGAVFRAGRRGRHERAHHGRGARHSGRTHCLVPPARASQPLSRGGRARQHQPCHVRHCRFRPQAVRQRAAALPGRVS